MLGLKIGKCSSERNRLLKGKREQEGVKNGHALTASFANNKALKIRLASAAAGITDYLGMGWELLFPAATANTCSSPAEAGSLFLPALILSLPHPQEN